MDDMMINDFNKLSDTEKNFLGISAEDFNDNGEIEDNMWHHYIITLKINGNKYKLLHGFPGDAPVGFFYINDEKAVQVDPDSNRLLTIDPKYESNDVVKKFVKWYFHESEPGYQDNIDSLRV